jgi:hypothetical protein
MMPEIPAMTVPSSKTVIAREYTVELTTRRGDKLSATAIGRI